MKKIFVLVALIWLFDPLFAAKVDTVSVFSGSMKRHLKSCVITPDSYAQTGKPYPTVYLLMGYALNYADWLKYFPDLKQLADRYNTIIVCPNSGYSSWYFDSPVDSSMKFETYVVKELVHYIDISYNTLKDRKGRAITGLSMGGHGALYLSIKHQDVFGAAGSMSGGLDFRPFPTNWDLPKRLGEKKSFPENWEKNTMINLLHLLGNNDLSILIDCGVDDFFLAANRAVHEKMLYMNIKHDYIERPGGHTMEYWNNALQYQMLFFDIFFNSQKS